MLLSSRARYGVRAMFQLATHWGEGPVSLSTVAREQDLSLAYLEQLLGVLRRCGLVASVRGRHGGYQLSREPSRVSVGEIIRALEGPVFVSACADPDPDFEECGRGEFCVSRLLWMRVHRKIEEAFDSTSLGDLCQAARCKREEASKALR
ncbi:MAG: RrF2 family transcriptional regulator [Acidobacteriota bacterium]